MYILVVLSVLGLLLHKYMWNGITRGWQMAMTATSSWAVWTASGAARTMSLLGLVKKSTLLPNWSSRLCLTVSAAFVSAASMIKPKIFTRKINHAFAHSQGLLTDLKIKFGCIRCRGGSRGWSVLGFDHLYPRSNAHFLDRDYLGWPCSIKWWFKIIFVWTA